MAARALSFLRPAVRSSGLQIRRCLSEHVHSSSKTTSFTPWLLGSATAMCVATGAAYYARQAFVDQESEYGVLTRAYAAPMPTSTMAEKNKERTFLMIKPDGVQRGLIAALINRFEQRGYKLIAMKFVKPSEELLKKHYADLSDKPFFPGLIKYVGSGPVVAMAWEGKDMVKQGRQMLGETNPLASKPGSIRGDFSIDIGRNIIHGSDSVGTAEKEIALWFSKDEIVEWTSVFEKMVYE